MASLSLEQFGIDRLSQPERLEPSGLLWDSLPEGGAGFVPPEWHLRELDRRLAEADANPDDVEPWSDVLARLA